MQLQGEPAAVVNNVQSHGSGFAMFAVANNGTVCYQAGKFISELRWLDRSGAVLATFGEPAEHATPTLDAARRQFVASRTDPTTGTLDLWHYDMDRNVANRLTFDPNDDWSGILSPDGKRVAFSSNRTNFPQIYIKEVNGAEPERALL